MGGNELLNVRKIKCCMAGPRANRGPFQSSVSSTILLSDLGWMVGRSSEPASYLLPFSILLSNFPQLPSPQSAVKGTRLDVRKPKF